jgi:hypothetical protein
LFLVAPQLRVFSEFAFSGNDDMLTVDDVLRMAKASGVTVRVEGYDLVLEHGVDSSVDVLAMLRRYKPELVSALRMRRANEPSHQPPEAVASEASGANRDAALLQAMSENPDCSMQDWATASGQSKRAVQTALEGRLTKRRLVENPLGKWRLTDEGRKAISEGHVDATNAA